MKEQLSAQAEPLPAGTPLHAVVVMPLAEQRGGAERLLSTLLDASVGSPEVVYELVFLQDGPMVDQVRALGYATHLVPAGRLRQGIRTAATVVRLAGLLRRIKPHVAMAWMAKAHLYVSPAALLARVPAVWWQHGISDCGIWDVAVTRLPAAAIFCCSAAAAEAQSRLRPRRPLRIIHPGIDLERLDPDRLPHPDEARRRLGLPGERPIVAAFARLQRWKGLHLLIEAIAALPRSERPLTVICGGAHFSEPNYPAELRTQVARLGLDDSVLFAGHVENVDLWMQAADVVVQPNILPEPFGMALVEAMALAKPVIAAAAGGPREIITEHGYDGWLIEPGDVLALADLIRRLCQDPELRRRVGRQARQRAHAFGKGRFADQVRHSLQSL